MAEINLEGTPHVQPVEADNNNLIDNDIAATSSNIEVNNNSFADLTYEENNDPNKINVTITDNETPLVVLFGPPACGKTMTLVRLTRYLKSQSYSITPVRSFKRSNDQHYEQMCNDFDELISQDDAAGSTSRMNYMLVKVSKQGKTICQILEAPGEHYFNIKDPKAPFPSYVNTIIHSNNRKIWLIMVEPDWKNEVDRRNYVERIIELKRKLRSRDKAIFIFNKIDKTDFVLGPGKVNLTQARKHIQQMYPNIFSMFRNDNPVTKFFKEYNCDFTPFQTGDFSKTYENKLTFQEGPDEYPRHLWNIMLKNIRG